MLDSAVFLLYNFRSLFRTFVDEYIWTTGLESQLPARHREDASNLLKIAFKVGVSDILPFFNVATLYQPTFNLQLVLL
jgi:hypothetical protein